MAKSKNTGGCGTFFILLAILYAIAQFIEENYVTICIVLGIVIFLILIYVVSKHKKKLKATQSKMDTINESQKNYSSNVQHDYTNINPFIESQKNYLSSIQLDRANSLINRAHHLTDILNTTVDREEFYISFDELTSVLKTLSEFEGKINFLNALPSEELQRINDQKQASIDFLERRIKEAESKPQNNFDIIPETVSEKRGEIDPYFASAGRFVIEKEVASIGMLQRLFKIGFNRAARIMDQLYDAGVVGPELGTKPRKILMTEKEFIEAIEAGRFDNINFENVPVHDFAQPSSSLERIKWYNNKFDYMTGNDFEQFCALVLQGNGYATRITPASGDFGVDIIAEQSGITYAIQCKCYSSDIGVDAVYQVAGGMKYYQANLGIVLTNRYFTRQAQELASGIGVVLWDRDSLIKLIHTSGLNDSSELTNIEEVTPEADELAAIEAYKSGDPDYQPSISQEDLIKELKITK